MTEQTRVEELERFMREAESRHAPKPQKSRSVIQRWASILRLTMTWYFRDSKSKAANRSHQKALPDTLSPAKRLARNAGERTRKGKRKARGRNKRRFSAYHTILPVHTKVLGRVGSRWPARLVLSQRKASQQTNRKCPLCSNIPSSYWTW